MGKITKSIAEDANFYLPFFCCFGEEEFDSIPMKIGQNYTWANEILNVEVVLRSNQQARFKHSEVKIDILSEF